MTTLIQNGYLIDPAQKLQGRFQILLKNGRVTAVTKDTPPADRVIDAGGMVVCPGFLDIHMHEDPVENGEIQVDIMTRMLSMGVTTAVGGNCGDNACDPGDYLDLADRQGLPCNIAMLAGHTYFRQLAGAKDKYGPVTPDQLAAMVRGIEKALERGCLGLSYGVRYVPGTTTEELLATAAACKKTDKLIAAHIRDDAGAVFSAAEEMAAAAEAHGLSLELSHIGSMAGFGQMERFLAMTDTWRARGLRVDCDCYPYTAFSTELGSTTYDEGWLERYGCGYGVLELAEGPYKGRRCTEEIFRAQRRDNPTCVTVCHVMRERDVEPAVCRPGVIVASDGVLSNGQGHPRAAGTFPRLFAQFVRTGKLTLYEAVEKITALPAAKLKLPNKGTLRPGADGDLVIFDPEAIRDTATFHRPIEAPEGIAYVLLGGEIALQDGRILRDDLGRSVRY